MKALIIEDETAAALNLKAILKQAAPDIRVVDTLESVEESVDWLRANPQPDLLFMDIQSGRRRFVPHIRRRGGHGAGDLHDGPTTAMRWRPSR